MISSSVAFLVSQNVKVHVDLEHFYDGFLGARSAPADPDYALQCAQTAVAAGAEAVVLCDTNGGRLPWDVADATAAVVAAVPSTVSVGVHAHDDSGLAVANSLAAVRAGATLVQGTQNGVGERTGNANLNAVVGALALKGDRVFEDGATPELACAARLETLSATSRFVDETLNLAPRASQPTTTAAWASSRIS